MEQDDDDVLGLLTYVVENIDTLDKETIVLVIKAALAEIIDLRIAVRAQGGS